MQTLERPAVVGVEGRRRRRGGVRGMQSEAGRVQWRGRSFRGCEEEALGGGGREAATREGERSGGVIGREKPWGWG